MVARRINMHRLQELVRLHRLNVGAREVARLLTMSPNTERDYRRALQDVGLLDGPVDELPELATLQAAVLAHRGSLKQPTQSVSTLERWRGEIEVMRERGAGPRATFDALRLKK
ncbi:MAG: hypothetical protein AAF735_08080 [Myxococcota bacterium]